MWHLTHNAPKGCRKHKDVFNWVQVNPKTDDQDSMWCPSGNRHFDTRTNLVGLSYSNSLCGINSVRAFVRFLRKHGDNLKGYEVVLCSSYYVRGRNGEVLYDYSVQANWVE